MVTYNVVYVDLSDDPNAPLTVMKDSINQQSTFSFARGIKYAMDNLCGDEKNMVYVETRHNGQLIDQMQI